MKDYNPTEFFYTDWSKIVEEATSTTTKAAPIKPATKTYPIRRWPAMSEAENQRAHKKRQKHNNSDQSNTKSTNPDKSLNVQLENMKLDDPNIGWLSYLDPLGLDLIRLHKNCA